ncbi:hypothetical protein M422DRAFT_46639 [Sphaerobolus stellatus SS14]|uniref:Uncharacterized protein n=1 Tax=Sphaerobolus stellatus (strain SS14) TaxID=990650 RepID=A0A0C9VEY8_SPHS4|nr:hypothetical protein M422DRAFT_46639 [Sphaerobolus stellatus SS14]
MSAFDLEDLIYAEQECEIGFYEGFAKLWQAALNVKASPEQSSNSRSIRHYSILFYAKLVYEKAFFSRIQAHIRHLDLIAQFPRVNPKPTSVEGEVDVCAPRQNSRRSPFLRASPHGVLA